MNSEYQRIQEQEAATWCIEDPLKRAEKLQRETIRYPYMAKQMGLNFLDTSNMTVYDIGGGPVGLSSIIPCKNRLVVDPLKDEYSKYFDTSFHLKAQAENLGENLKIPDLIIATNSMDHFEDPVRFLEDLREYMKPGGFFSQFHAINNALTHPHEAHQWNINSELLHRFLDTDFETVWELKYPEVRYGWVNYNGKVGQPAFASLHRRVTGY